MGFDRVGGGAVNPLEMLDGGPVGSEGTRAAVRVGPAVGAGDGEGINPTMHLAAFLTVPSSGLYLAFSSSGSDFHIRPRVCSLSALRKPRGRSGRCSWQKTVSVREQEANTGSADLQTGGSPV